MQRSQTEMMLSSGQPLEDPAHDKLGYARFAETLSNGIQKMTPPEGLVIAVYGAWGSGKTSMLNFVEHFANLAHEGERPTIFRFNPWWFSGAEELTSHFFTELQFVLGKSHKFDSELLTNLSDLAEAASEITPFPGLVKLVALGLRKVAKQQKKDIMELKGEIADSLKQQKTKILIIIDDIDRLTTDEIRQVFRVIKAVADFPNVVYLLAFDKKVIVKALTGMQDLPGEQYLEKIVQVPFELPSPDRLSMQSMLLGRLNVISAGTPPELFDQNEWAIAYIQGIDHFIRTPRDIVRFTNTVSVTYPAVKGEVNLVDFLVIETIRIFCSDVYSVVRDNPNAFTGPSDVGLLIYPKPISKEQLKAFHDDWLSQIDPSDRESITRLIERVFPKTESAWGNMSFGSEWLPRWRKARRACDPDTFPIYFRLAIPTGDLSNAEMKAIMNLTNDQEKFAAVLVELSGQVRPDGTTKVHLVLDRLQDYIDEIQTASIAPIVRTLFDVGDKLLVSRDRSAGLLNIENDIRISRILYQLLRRMNENDRFELLKQSIVDGRAISTIVHEVAIFGQEQGKYGASPSTAPSEVTVSKEHLAELELSALQKIRDFATQGTLLQAPNFLGPAYRWLDWGGEPEVKEWIRTVTETREGLALYLVRIIVPTLSTETTKYDFDSTFLKLLEPSRVADRVRGLSEDASLSDNERLAVQVFLKKYGKSDNAI